jgi:type IV fimbrial biogenesis protein FimT
MVTIAVLSVLFSLTAFGMQAYVRNNRLVSQTNSLVGALQLARTEAVKRGGNVYICGSSDLTACNTSTWSSGYLVFYDPDADAVDTSGDFNGTAPNTSDMLLLVGDPMKGGTSARSLNFTKSNYVRYSATGKSDSSGSFVICDDENNVKRARAINIGFSGLVSLAEDTDGTPDNIVNLPSGANVSCP